MFGMMAPLAYLLFSWGAITAVLVILVVYAWIVSNQEDQFHMRKLEDERVAAQEVIITEKLSHLKRGIVPLAALSVVLLLATAVVWVWYGLKG